MVALFLLSIALAIAFLIVGVCVTIVVRLFIQGV